MSSGLDNIKKALAEMELNEDVENEQVLLTDFADWEEKFVDFDRRSDKGTKKPLGKFRWGLVAAAVACCLVISVPVYGVVRQAVEMIFTKNDYFTTIKYDVQSDVQIPEYIEHKYVPEWVPEDFSVEKMYFYEDEQVKVCAINYVNDEGGSIYFDQSTLDGANRKHDEGAVVTQVEVAGCTAYLYTNLKSNGLFWTDEEYAFSINYSGVSDEDIIKMAESLE